MALLRVTVMATPLLRQVALSAAARRGMVMAMATLVALRQAEIAEPMVRIAAPETPAMLDLFAGVVDSMILVRAKPAVVPISLVAVEMPAAQAVAALMKPASRKLRAAAWMAQRISACAAQVPVRTAEPKATIVATAAVRQG